MGEILRENYEKLKPYYWQVSYNGKVLREFPDFVSMHNYFVNCKKDMPEDDKALFSWKLMWKTED